MMRYSLEFAHPQEQIITVTTETTIEPGKTVFHLSKWRPGRYELQTYPKNVADVKAIDSNKESLHVERESAHSWSIRTEEKTTVTLSYVYYANQPDAGGSFVDSDRIYVNGINLFLFTEETLMMPCELILDLPADYQIAGGFKGKYPTFTFENFHQLVDTPFLAGNDLIHHEFMIDNISTHLWFQGNCRPDLQKMERDVRNYSQAQLALFGEFPVEEYHYLYVILPYRFRHGVEHHNSTVISMGPGHQLMTPLMYKSWLEISSHELFHTWNVKALRPADMYPYDYQQENYSKLHYVTEGVTTYYGDLMIWKGGIWSVNEWIESINGELNTFYQMGGMHYISLEEASFTSWVNGYQKDGIPNRRISFYTKGYLVSMLLDIEIRRATNNQHSLDHVMREMYRTIAKNNRGYTREDYQELIEKFSGRDFSEFFDKFISGTYPLEKELVRLGEYMGFNLMMFSPNDPAEAWWGLKTSHNTAGVAVIDEILPESPALAAGLSQADEIISVNGSKVDQNLQQLLGYYSLEDQLTLHYFHLGQLQSTQLKRNAGYHRMIPQFRAKSTPTPEQLENRAAWQRINVGMEVNA